MTAGTYFICLLVIFSSFLFKILCCRRVVRVVYFVSTDVYICVKFVLYILTMNSSVRLVALRRLFNSAVWNYPILKTSYHTDTAETLHTSVDTSSRDYKVTTQVHAKHAKLITPQQHCVHTPLCALYGNPLIGGPKLRKHVYLHLIQLDRTAES